MRFISALFTLLRQNHGGSGFMLVRDIEMLNTLFKRLEDGLSLSDRDVLSILELPASVSEWAGGRLQEIVRLKRESHRKSHFSATEPPAFFKRTPLFLTNLCELEPSIYQYPRLPGARDAYVCSIDDIDQRMERAIRYEFEEVFLISGFWSELKLPGLEAPTLFHTLKNLLVHLQDRYPQLALIGFCPDEIDFLQIITGKSHGYLLEFLKDMGLKTLSPHLSLTLSDEARQAVSPKLTPVKTWWEIQETACRLGLQAHFGFSFGYFESPAQRLQHLRTIRDFTGKHPDYGISLSLHPVTYSPPLTHFSPLQASAIHAEKPKSLPSHIMTPEDRLRHLAIAFLYLSDVLPLLPAYWLTHQSARSSDQKAFEETKASLDWGANHLGSTADLAYMQYLAGAVGEITSLSAADMAAFT